LRFAKKFATLTLQRSEEVVIKGAGVERGCLAWVESVMVGSVDLLGVLLQLLHVAGDVNLLERCSQVLSQVLLSVARRLAERVLHQVDLVGALGKEVDRLVPILAKRLEQRHRADAVVEEQRVAVVVGNMVDIHVGLARFEVIFGLVEHVGDSSDLVIVLVVNVLGVELLEVREVVLVGLVMRLRGDFSMSIGVGLRVDVGVCSGGVGVGDGASSSVRAS